MTIQWDQFLDVFSAGAVIGTIVFGLLLGATYGWRSGNGALELAILGLGFLLVQAVAVAAAGPALWERYAARGLLWIVLCLLLRVGRGLRIRAEAWRLKNRIRRARRDRAC